MTATPRRRPAGHGARRIGGNGGRLFRAPEPVPDDYLAPIDFLGEELVDFRDEQDRIGLLDRHWSHRGTDISYGRLENGGLRCLYHGWLYDVNGKCLEKPAEPPGSQFKAKYVSLRMPPTKPAAPSSPVWAPARRRNFRHRNISI